MDVKLTVIGKLENVADGSGVTDGTSSTVNNVSDVIHDATIGNVTPQSSHDVWFTDSVFEGLLRLRNLRSALGAAYAIHILGSFQKAGSKIFDALVELMDAPFRWFPNCARNHFCILFLITFLLMYTIMGPLWMVFIVSFVIGYGLLWVPMALANFALLLVVIQPLTVLALLPFGVSLLGDFLSSRRIPIFQHDAPVLMLSDDEVNSPVDPSKSSGGVTGNFARHHMFLLAQMTLAVAVSIGIAALELSNWRTFVAVSTSFYVLYTLNVTFYFAQLTFAQALRQTQSPSRVAAVPSPASTVSVTDVPAVDTSVPQLPSAEPSDEAFWLPSVLREGTDAIRRASAARGAEGLAETNFGRALYAPVVLICFGSMALLGTFYSERSRTAQSDMARMLLRILNAGTGLSVINLSLGLVDTGFIWYWLAVFTIVAVTFFHYDELRCGMRLMTKPDSNPACAEAILPLMLYSLPLVLIPALSPAARHVIFRGLL